MAADVVCEVDEEGETSIVLQHTVGDGDARGDMCMINMRVEHLRRRHRRRPVDANDDLRHDLVPESTDPLAGCGYTLSVQLHVPRELPAEVAFKDIPHPLAQRVYDRILQ